MTGAINNYGELNILKGTTGQSNEDAKVAVLTNGNFNNKADGIVTVEGVLAVLPGKASNEGTIYDKVSSQITGDISDLNGEYVCEVDNDEVRFKAALDERPTTIIRFVGSSNSYTMNQVIGSKRESKIKKYVVAATGVKFTAKDDVKDKDGKDVNNLIPVSINNLEVEASADLTVETDATSDDALYLTVTESVKVAGTMTLDVATDRDLEVFKAAAVTIANSKDNHGAMTFSKNVKSTLASLNIEGIGKSSATAADSGSATFDVNSVTTVSGAIVNNGYGFIKLASGGSTDVSARVWYDAVAPIGNGNWANGTPTKVIK